MKETITKITASNMARVMACRGCVRFENLPKFEQTSEGLEGDLAEEVLNHLIAGREIPLRSKKGQIFDEDMIFFAQKTAPNIQQGADQQIRCDWVAQGSNIAITGKFDYSWESDGGQLLNIFDYKYGWGIVETEKNYQLLCYAVGEIIRRGKYYPTIRMIIGQPRPHHIKGPIREWIITYDELLSYKAEIEAVLLEMVNGNVTLATSSNCKYCPAGKASVCPALRRAFYKSVDVIMEDFNQEYMTEEDISNELDLLERVKALLDIRRDGLEEVAKRRMAENKLIPNWSTIDVFGHRTWKQGITVNAIQALTGEKIVQEKMMSPAEVEKKFDFPEMLMNSLTSRSLKGRSLKRMNAGKVADEIFKNVTNNQTMKEVK